MSYNFMVTNLI